MFRVIVAGSRTFNDYALLSAKLDQLLAGKIAQGEKIVIVSGGARGADKLGERYANERNFEIDLHPASWEKHGRSAGYIRNEEMARAADALVAFWDGSSRGTKHMIDLARKYNLQVRVI